ncbi:signal recognition particle 19 kDa protein-like [Rhopilema esculentum]|uniref:signal recognition particle 19 kDa protein-like n=1 Tax=Rhopilema esculentum TaxID=499914 RepID=UPI0031D8F83D
MAHLTTDPSNESRWIVVYPNFLNSRKTIKDGRKIAKSKGVDNPRCNEMKDVLQYHGFNCIVEEQKQYPRDSAKDALCKGRVRIQLKNSDGTLFNPNYPSRESLMILLGEMIPKLKSRQAKGAAADTISQSSKKGKEKKKK